MLKNIGIVGGGQMAEALIKGFLEKDLFSAKDIIVAEPIKERRQYLEEYYHIHATPHNRTVLEKESIILLAVKPQVMEAVLKEINPFIETNRHLLITIAAGLRLEFYEKRLPPGTRLVRVMPNTCALVQSSISAICKGSYATEEDVRLVEEIFRTIGEVLRVEEYYMDAVTALSGSGPAYVALFVEALIDGGVRCGLPRMIAEKLALATMEGTLKLMKISQKNPYEVKAMVTSPAGTTITAMEWLYKEGFPGIIIEALRKAWERSKELSSELSGK